MDWESREIYMQENQDLDIEHMLKGLQCRQSLYCARIADIDLPSLS